MEIIIEGMDGVGKTTVAKKLCERHNFKYVNRPLPHLFGVGELRTKDDIDFQNRLNQIFKEDNKIQAWIYISSKLWICSKYS